MQNVNLHQQRLIALAIALVAIIAMFLTWTHQSMTGIDNFFNQVSISSNDNGFRSVGFLSLLGVIGVIAAAFLGDKTKAFEQQSKMIGLISFGAIAAGALIYFLILMSKSKQYGASAGIGLWIALIAGIAGLVFLSGILNQMGAKTTGTGSSTPTTGAPPPPPRS
ncbi:MAG TPA: hypothetical protein VET23_00525 [Chitinophagaceae bacterium]|nr:hypothetical protein [Chitinophagaceae bacterium]